MWELRLTPAGTQPPKQWSSNDEILASWNDHLQSHNFSRNVREHYPVLARVYARAWPCLITTLSSRDVAAFAEAIGKKCRHLQRGLPPRCRRGKTLTTCPMLLATPATNCTEYQSLQPSGVLSYLSAISSLYRWLVHSGHIGANPAEPVVAEYLERHKAFFEERKRNPNRRKLHDDEVRRLVERTPIRIGIIVALQAKGFLRIHEVMKLRCTSEFLNLEEGWLDIPRDNDYGNKRLGVNHRVILDAELQALLRRYLQWREGKVRRNDLGEPVTDKLCITNSGNAWTPTGFAGNYKQQLHQHCIRLGIMNGKETESRQRVNTHAFRAWACSWAAAHGAEPGQIRVLKGDRMPGTLDEYDDQQRRLPDLYRRFGPVLGLKP